MTKPDYDDPVAEEQWCAECRATVAAYLTDRKIEHARVGEWPAWHIAPYVSIWAIESAKRPEKIGWWVICGDLPTDYISADAIKHPRDAMRGIAERWMEVSASMKRGEAHPTVTIGPPELRSELGLLLEKRAELLLEWTQDDALWEPE